MSAEKQWTSVFIISLIEIDSKRNFVLLLSPSKFKWVFKTSCERVRHKSPWRILSISTSLSFMSWRALDEALIPATEFAVIKTVFIFERLYYRHNLSSASTISRSYCGVVSLLRWPRCYNSSTVLPQYWRDVRHPTKNKKK